MNAEERLEEELGRMRPAGLRGELMGRVAETMEERLTAGDRVLAAWTGMGALAACVMVGVMVWQLALPAQGASEGPGRVSAARRDVAAEVERWLASRG
jgi:hypothetical protein